MTTIKEDRFTTWMWGTWAALLLFCAHYWQPNGGGDGLYIPNNNLVWIAVSIICAIGILSINKLTKITWSPVLSKLALVCTSLLLPYFWSDTSFSSDSIPRIFAILAWLLMATSLFQFRSNALLSKLFWFVVIAAWIQALIGLVQFIKPDWFIAISNHRPVGSFYQANVFASLLATGLALSIWLMNQATRKQLFILILGMSLLSGLLYLVMSRTGIIASVIVTLTMLFFVKKRSHILSILVSIAIGITIAFAAQSATNIESRDGISDPGYRTTLYSQSVELISEQPLLGHGIGSFARVYTEKLAKTYSENPSTPMYNALMTHPHNELLFWWVEGGAVPVFALLAFAVWFSIIVWRNGEPFNKAAWLATIPIILHTQTEFPLYHSATHLAILTLLIVAASPKKLQSDKQLSVQLVLLPKFFATLGVTLTAFLMLTNLHTTTIASKVRRSQDPAHLQNVINPFFQPRLIKLMYGEALIRSGKKQAIELALELIKESSHANPSIGAFLLQHRALVELERLNEAEQLLTHARYLYPKAKQLQRVGQVTVHSLPASAAH